MSTAGFHITEDCAEVYLQNESGMEFFQLAMRLHDYLQQGQRLPARSLFEATDDCKEISHEAFNALVKRRMENTGEVSGLFELDFDARTLSALNIMDGWKVYAMQDVANAAAQAFQEAEISEDDRWRIFLDRLDGRELTTPSRLTARNFYFEDSIEAMDDRILNFYVVPCFNVDEVFGTFVETDENDHALNIYANYDMQRQQVCDTLEMTLYGSGIEDQSLTYHLNAAEKEVLREKMEAYCSSGNISRWSSSVRRFCRSRMRPRRRCSCDRQRVPRRRACVGGLCGFPDTAERVPAESHKTERCAGVRELYGNGRHRRKPPAGGFRRREKPQAARQEKRLGAFLRQPVHFCPQCGQFWTIKRRFSARVKSGLALIFGKSQDCAAVAGTVLALFVFGGR